MRALIAVLLVAVSACTTTMTVGYPAEYVSMKSPSHVWVTLKDKTMTELSNPQIKGEQGDTLVGFNSTGAYTEIPVADVQIMKAKESAAGKTAVVVGLAAIGTAAAAAALMGSGTGDTCYDRATGGVKPC